MTRLDNEELKNVTGGLRMNIPNEKKEIPENIKMESKGTMGGISMLMQEEEMMHKKENFEIIKPNY